MILQTALNIIRGSLTAIAAIVFCSSAHAEWVVKSENDPFSGKQSSQMLTSASGTLHARAISVGCAAHGYAALTVMLRQMVRDKQSTGRRIPMLVTYKLGRDGKEIELESELYETVGNTFAIRSNAVEATRIVALLEDASSDRGPLFVKVEGIDGFASSDPGGIGYAARQVLKSCGQRAPTSEPKASSSASRLTGRISGTITGSIEIFCNPNEKSPHLFLDWPKSSRVGLSSIGISVGNEKYNVIDVTRASRGGFYNARSEEVTASIIALLKDIAADEQAPVELKLLGNVGVPSKITLIEPASAAAKILRQCAQ